MENVTRVYIKSELIRLDSGEVKNLTLKGVYPSVLEGVLGSFEDVETNGWQGDYWTKTDKYEISGCMYYGKATISLRGE
ncbi:TPA: hypothetical protein QCW42_004090 [Bacillus cereus]|nr:hypothetical protein [Bacillus cereus]